MTIKELKKALEGIDENMEVIIEDTNTLDFFSTLDNIFVQKVNGKTYAVASNCPFNGSEFKGKKEF